MVVLQAIFDLAPFPKNSENHEKPKLTEASVFTEASVTSVFHEFLHFFEMEQNRKWPVKPPLRPHLKPRFQRSIANIYSIHQIFLQLQRV